MAGGYTTGIETYKVNKEDLYKGFDANQYVTT